MQFSLHLLFHTCTWQFILLFDDSKAPVIQVLHVLDISRSRPDAPQSVGLLWTSDQLIVEISDNTQYSQQTST